MEHAAREPVSWLKQQTEKKLWDLIAKNQRQSW